MRMWVQLVRLIVKPGYSETSRDVAPPVNMPLEDSDFAEAPFGGLRFLNGQGVTLPLIQQMQMPHYFQFSEQRKQP